MKTGVVALLTAVLAAAQTTSGIHRHPTGVTVRVPAGWSAHDGPTGIALLPPGVVWNDALSEVYIAASRGGFSGLDDPHVLDELRSAMSQAATATPVKETFSAGARTGNVLTWELRDPQTGTPAMMRVYLTASGERVHSLLVLAARDTVLRRDPELRSAAATIAFDAGAAAAAAKELAPNSATGQFWLNRLRGRMLTQMATSRGFESKRVIYLNADGSYVLSGHSLVSATVPGVDANAGSRAREEGRWRISTSGDQAFLHLKPVQGRETVLPLTIDGRTTFVDGVKTFITEQK